jgi:HSP20 family protein
MADVRSENRGPSSQRSDVERPQRTEQEAPKNESVVRRQPAGGLGLYRDPFWSMNSLRREMDRLFENFGFGSSLLYDFDRLGWTPQIEMNERDGKLIVKADLPGLNKDDVKIELNDNVLTIEGERKDERKDERGGWSERSYGQFFRSITLPEGIRTENANATFKNGVLEITFDAPQQSQPRGRRIDIK